MLNADTNIKHQQTKIKILLLSIGTSTNKLKGFGIFYSHFPVSCCVLWPKSRVNQIHLTVSLHVRMWHDSNAVFCIDICIIIRLIIYEKITQCKQKEECFRPTNTLAVMPWGMKYEVLVLNRHHQPSSIWHTIFWIISDFD